MAELKPCPFCGGNRMVVVKSDSGFNVAWHRVKCEKCGALGQAFYSSFMSQTRTVGVAESEAVEAWNRRV